MVFWRKVLKSLRIKSIKKVSEEDVYDIQNFEKDVFKNESNFIIDDIVAHNCGNHAGGCLLLDDDVWNYIPVVHTKDGIATAFVENSSEQILDEISIVKYDFLSISVLEVISNAIDSIDDELILIEDEDGIVKIVGASYLKNKEIEV